MLKLNDFNYTLPASLIANEPPTNRGDSRLLLINRQSEEITDHHMKDLSTLLPSDTSIVLNNTKVFPSRLYGKKTTGGKVEILLLKEISNNKFICITKPGIKLNSIITFPGNLEATCTNSHGMNREIEFNKSGSELMAVLRSIGHTPIPPYIKSNSLDDSRYQTVYAKSGFSAAAPTAGLHFTAKHLKELSAYYPILEITLNVGLGTFLPVKIDDISKHKMHEESYTIDDNTALQLNKAKRSKNNILTIGTTTTRTLESNYQKYNSFMPTREEAGIFIYPPYKFRTTNMILTNFHLPKSTLLMMISAFTSYPNAPKNFTTFKSSLLYKAYMHAIKNKYRFYSFGDAMLII